MKSNGSGRATSRSTALAGGRPAAVGALPRRHGPRRRAAAHPPAGRRQWKKRVAHPAPMPIAMPMSE